MRSKRWAAFVILPIVLWLIAISVVAAMAQNAPPRLATSQATVTTTAAVTAIARANRMAVTIQNHGATAIYCGPDATVTTTTGFRIPGVDGANVTITTTAAVYCIVGAGTQAVSVLETY